jgi:hypothetical protein
MSAHAGGISIAVDNTGDLSVIGHFSGDVTLGAGEAHETTLHADEWGIFVATYDANGLLRRVQQAEGMGYKSITGVARDSAGHLYMTGEFYGPTRLATFGGDDVYHITLKSHSKHGDIFVAKFGGGPPFVVLADSTVTLDRPGASEGAIWTNGAITFPPSPADAPSVFTGDLIARKDITIHPGNTLTGTATAQGLVQVLPGATVTGEILANATVPRRPLPQPTFTANGPDQIIPCRGVLALAPGTYGQVILDRDSTLQLRSGAYFLRSLTLGKAARLVVDVSDGPVSLHVVESLVIGKQAQVRLTPDAADSALFTMTTLQTARLVIEDQAQVVGTLLVPYAAVRLDPESQFTGALIADKVTVQPGAMLQPHGTAHSML